MTRLDDFDAFLHRIYLLVKALLLNGIKIRLKLLLHQIQSVTRTQTNFILNEVAANHYKVAVNKNKQKKLQIDTVA